MLRQAAEHRGAALVEIYQNCPIFNDGAFDVLKDRDEARARLVPLEHGQPIRFGTPTSPRTAGTGSGRGASSAPPTASCGSSTSPTAAPDGRASTRSSSTTRTTPDPSAQFALSRLDDPSMAHVPDRRLPRRSGGRRTTTWSAPRSASAVEAAGGPATDDDLGRLLAGKDTWTV